MSFSVFSNEFHDNMFTNVENAFITRYLPYADGDAVRVYLYGLYLCSRREDFEADSAAKLLRIPPEQFREIYRFWEECGLVRILCDNPLRLEYLPVSDSLGKPKPARPEKYTEFNKELYRRVQRIGRDVQPFDSRRIFSFLEESGMEPQAFLLIVEYCIKRDEDFKLFHILNKARQLSEANKITFDQIEAELSDFNDKDELLKELFALLGITRKKQSADYDFIAKWESLGMGRTVLITAAAHLNKGSMRTLDTLVGELNEEQIKTAPAAREYFKQREEDGALVYAVSRKLGIKVETPHAYIEAYAKKWRARGYTTECLSAIASLGFKFRFGFPETDALLEKLYEEGITTAEDIIAYCKPREKNFRLLLSVQAACPTIRVSRTALDTILEWKAKGFDSEIILEAAHRSKEASSPLLYMNKMLDDWQKEGIVTPSEIPQRAPKDRHKKVVEELAIAADKRTDREHFYAVRKQAAINLAEKNRALAETDEEFKESESVIKRGEIELAKAELYAPATLPDILTRMQEANEKRKRALERLRLTEQDLLPQYTCRKCSDTGFLPNGTPCDCYPTD